MTYFMKANPGGQLDPSQIVGRDALIRDLWAILEGRGIYMNDLRRIGKTQILVKMHAAPPAGWHPLKRDLGGLHTAAEFAAQVYRDAAELLSPMKRTLRGLVTVLKDVEAVGVLKLRSGEAAPWKEVLARTFRDLDAEMADLRERVVFLWDEVPYLLENIAKREGSAVAMEVLDALRALSQDYDRVRLVLTGSIGLHHVLRGLAGEGYNGSPLNRMEFVKPGPLEEKDARALACALLVEKGCHPATAEPCARTLAEAVGNVAFYIHRLISRLPLPPRSKTGSSAKSPPSQMTGTFSTIGIGCGSITAPMNSWPWKFSIRSPSASRCRSTRSGWP
jgi:hypothetical protein